MRTVEISARDLVSHAFRSLLTTLGVVFGVGAVVGMLAISEGAKRESLGQIEALGIENIVLRSVKPTSGTEAAKEGSSWVAVEYGIKPRDLAHIRNVFENIRMVVPVRDARKPIYARGVRTDVHVFATTPAFLDLTNSRLADPRGRFLSDLDGTEAHPVCVVGIHAARQLFRYHDPLGRDVMIGGEPFRVVGILEQPFSVKMLGGYDLNNQIFIHLDAADMIFGKTAVKRSAGSFEVTKIEADYLYINVEDVDQIENTAARLRTYLEEIHAQQDYEIQVPYELLKQRAATQRIYTIVMGSIAAISLLVGGIGIMNIMLANIYERTKEIGTRRALGAKKRDILLQFLTEAVLLTTLGGLLGVGLGERLAWAVRTFAGMQTLITPVSVIVSLGVSVAVGILFGTYPAWKAANLDPITALRTE